MARGQSRSARKLSSASKSTTAPSNIQRTEFVETTTAHPSDPEKAPLLSAVVPRGPHRPNLTPNFSTIASYSASEPSSQFDSQVDPASTIPCFESQDSALQPISEPSFDNQTEISRKDASETSESSDITDVEETESRFQELSVIDITVIEAIVVEEETPREDEESFGDYAARRAQSFGYRNLREQQVEALERLIEYKVDVMLVAKTSFGKSLIFQLAPLLTPDPRVPGIVLILMPLTLLQQNQAENVKKRGAQMGAKCIVLDQDRNHTRNRRLIAQGRYTHIFTSPEIVNDKPFRDEVTNIARFREKLCCVAIDEAHLVEEWKDFREEYARIGWFRQTLPRDVPFFAASATLSPITREKVRKSCNFRPNSYLIETTIDREEIFIGVYAMERARNSFLDISGILPEKVVTGIEIPKTVIFIDSISEIQAMRRAILNWMRKLNYPATKRQQWVKTYFAAMAKASKDSIAADFGTLSATTDGLVSPSCRILIATTAYGLGIDNPDIKQVILWGLPRSMADAMQRLGRAMRNGKGQAVARIFVPKWSIGPGRVDSRSKSSLSQSQLFEQPDIDEDGDLSDGISVITEQDTYVIEAGTGVKTRLTPLARREQMDAGLYRLANNPNKDCIRIMMLQEMGDTTYPSKEKPDLCCSACQPDQYSLKVNEALIPAKIFRKGVVFFFVEDRLTKWRADQIASEPKDSIYHLVPAAFMPDEVIKALTLRWKLILEEEDPAKSLQYVREGCQCWAEGEKYMTVIRTFLKEQLKPNFDVAFWHNQYGKRRWQDKKPKRIQKSDVMLKREGQREQRRLALASNKQSKGGDEAVFRGKTTVERLGGRPPSQKSISSTTDTRRELTKSKTDEAGQQRNEGGRFTNQGKRPTTSIALSPRKDNLKRAKSPNLPVPLSPTQSALAWPPTPPMPASPPVASTSDCAASPGAVRATSRAGRPQSPSAKKVYNSQ